MSTSLENGPSDLTMGNLWTSIWRMSWPMFLIMVFNFFVGLADIYVAGLIGPEFQAAVGYVSQIYFLVIIVANSISVGTIALVSRAIGSGDINKAREIARQALIFSVFVAIALSVSGFLFSEVIIAVSGFPPAIRDISENFFRILALALGPNYILIVSNAIFRATGEVKKPLLSMLIVSVVNIVGNFALVFGYFSFPKMGYIGIAVASAVSVTAGMFVNLIFFFTDMWKAIYARPWKMAPHMIKKIIGLGWPAALLQIAWNTGSIVLYGILGKLGERSITALASITNGLRIEAIIFLPAFALNMAVAVLVGQNLGARNPERAGELGWKIAFIGVAIISLIALLIFIWADDLASSFTGDASVREETTRYLRINMLSEPFMALGVVLAGGLQGAGDTRGTMWVIIIAMWLIRLPLAYFLAVIIDYGATGVWIAMVISMNIQGMLMAWRFHRGRWKKIRIA